MKFIRLTNAEDKNEFLLNIYSDEGISNVCHDSTEGITTIFMNSGGEYEVLDSLDEIYRKLRDVLG